MSTFSLEIHFPSSRSKNYPEVVKRARLFSDFTERPNVLKVHDIDELFGRWDDFSVVIFGATKWAGTTVYFGGKPILPYKNDFFYKLLDLKHCYEGYKGSVDKTGYCSDSDWGCRQLTSIGRYFEGPNLYMRKPWYKYGHFIDATTWGIDKNRIFEVLSEEAMLKMANECPGFDPARIEEFVSKLPDQIKVDGNWEVEYRLDVNSKGLVGIPININFVAYPEPAPEKIEDAFVDPELDPDAYLDKILRDREKNRKDDYSDLL